MKSVQPQLLSWRIWLRYPLVLWEWFDQCCFNLPRICYSSRYMNRLRFSQFRESGHNPDTYVAIIIEMILITARADILRNLFQYHYNINLRPKDRSIILNVSSYTFSIAIRMVNELVGCFCGFPHFVSFLLCLSMPDSIYVNLLASSEMHL